MSIGAAGISDDFFESGEASAETETESTPVAEQESAPVEAAPVEETSETSAPAEVESGESEVEVVAQESAPEETSHEKGLRDALVKERDARKDLEKEIAYLKGQFDSLIVEDEKKDESIEDTSKDEEEYWKNPVAYSKKIAAEQAKEIAQAALKAEREQREAAEKAQSDWNAKASASRDRALAQWPDYEANEKIAMELVKTTPGLKDAIMTAEDPAEFVQTYVKNLQGMFGGVTSQSSTAPQEKPNPAVEVAKNSPKPQGGARSSAPPSAEPALAVEDILGAATAHNKY